MPETTQIVVEGLDEMLDRLEKIAEGNYVRDVMVLMGKEIARHAGEYPPPSLANDPGNPLGRWYERGYGIRYASGGGRQTSEQLGKKWFVSPQQRAVVIGNTASYAPYVHSKDEQAAFHGERGWKVLEDEAEKWAPDIVRRIGDQIEEIWRR